MKVFAVKCDVFRKGETLGYLFYYENINEGCIEILDGLDEWDLPVILEHYVRNGRRSMTTEQTLQWVNQRIVPPDRQNIASILVSNGLTEYNPYELLIIADGRCAQDDCYIERVQEDEVPEEIRNRRRRNINNASLSKENDLVITFQDDSVVIVNLDRVADEYDWLQRILRFPHYLAQFQVTGGGSCVSWGEGRELPYDYLYDNGTKMPFGAEVFRNFACEQMLSTTEVMEILHCTRQNVNDLVKRGKLTAIDKNAKTKLFYRSEVNKLL